MTLKYGEDKYFIGVVKFFDSNKDFGFIASNSCGMDELVYEQDFYVNSDSFVETNAAKEGAIVVFQVELQNKGRTRAVNVRYIKKTPEDQQLALLYYGRYEKIKLKERFINIYCQIGIPRSMELEMVRDRIENFVKRNSQNTLNHFKFYVSHFKEKESASERYIFDRDWSREQKELWVALFSFLTEDEKKVILNNYPSALRYISCENIEEIVCSYIKTNSGNEKELAYIKKIAEDMLPGVKVSAQLQLEQIANEKILKLLELYGSDETLWKTIDEGNARFARFSPLSRFKKNDRDWINSKLAPQLKLTSRNFDNEINELLEKIRLNKFHCLLADYTPTSRVEQLSRLCDSFNSLSESNKKQRQQDLFVAIEASFTEAIKEDRIDDAMKVYSFTEPFGHQFTDKLKALFSPQAKKHFCESTDLCNTSNLTNYLSRVESCAIIISYEDLSAICEHCVVQVTKTDSLSVIFTFLNKRDCFKDVYSEQMKEKISATLRELLIKLADNSISSKNSFSQFFKEYEKYKDVLTTNDKSSIITYVKSFVEDSNLEIISELMRHEDFIVGIPKGLIMKKVMNLVADWEYVDFSNCFYKPDAIFSKLPELRKQIAQKGLELISKFKLSKKFGGSERTYSYRSAESSNCSYLKNLKRFIGNEVPFEPFDNYIKSRSADEQLILFDNDVITQLPSTITKHIVEQISVSDIEAPSIRWYSPPKLKNQLYIKVLSSAKDLFELIENRLSNLQLTKENILLSVILVELLSINKPQESGKEWDSEFSNKILSLSNRHPNNRMLKVVIWAIYLRIDKWVPVKDIFPYLPPYLQIKFIKWLFFNKADRKINFTAHNLSTFLGGNSKAICFSVAIVLEYLKLRENDPSATLTHNVMLRLLQDREDHSEWVGIRHFVDDCQGRYSYEYKKIEYDRWGNPKQNARWRFYNGLASKKDAKIVLFVPRCMVNENGEQQDYNNKLYNNICQYITLAFRDAKVAQNQLGLFCSLKEEYDIQVRSLVRMYNFRYGGLHDELINFSLDNREHEIQNFCECRLADKPDRTGFAFYWCANRPCFRAPVRYHLNSEWEEYTILDFLRILGIPADYTNKQGKTTRFGYYIILSSYLRSFAKFYEHLKCRGCGKLMKPAGGVSNFATRAVTEFSCDNPDCSELGKTVYLNHCFNKKKCDATIDSRDSKQCPNGQYICPECGACCSTKNFANRISNLQYTGGYISTWLENFVRNDLGHWEKGIRFCYKCGAQMQNGLCPNCQTKYKQ